MAEWIIVFIFSYRFRNSFFPFSLAVAVFPTTAMQQNDVLFSQNTVRKTAD